jgi:hypothetical protein
MNIIIKLLPIILIIVIFYLLIYNLYPQYKELINLTKKLNELQNKEKEVNALEKLIQSLSQNPNIQQLITNKETLNLWLPQKPEIETILAYLVGIYQINNLTFKGTDFKLIEEPKIYNSNVLPVKIISYNLEAKLNNTNLISFIEALEKNTRLMVIKKADIDSKGEARFEVESYYLSEK